MSEFKYGEYLQITAPDKEKLSKMLELCKGNERTMSQFAGECGINASTLSRILNGKITKPLTYEVLVLIYDHKAGTADLSFEQLAYANGMRGKEAHEKEKRGDLFYNDPIDKIERSNEIQRIIVNGLLLRGAMIQLDQQPRRYFAKAPEYRPSTFEFYPPVDFVVNIMTGAGNKEWDFYCYAKMLDDDQSADAVRELANSSIHMNMAFFLQDNWETQVFENVKSSFLFFEEPVYSEFVKLLRMAKINSEVSAILIDYIHGKVLKEEWIRECDQDKHSIFEKDITTEDGYPGMGLTTWAGTNRVL